MKQSGNYGTGLTLSGLPNLKQLLVWPGEGFTDKSNSKSTQVFYCTVYVYMADSTPLQRTALFHFKSLAKSFCPLWLFAHFPPVAIVGNRNVPWGGRSRRGRSNPRRPPMMMLLLCTITHGGLWVWIGERQGNWVTAAQPDMGGWINRLLFFFSFPKTSSSVLYVRVHEITILLPLF